MIKSLPFFDFFSKHLLLYPTSINLNFLWNFGSLILFIYIVQVFSGLFLAMHYTADSSLAFESVDYIMREVNNGWLIRYIHANFASAFFVFIYLHIAKAMFYQSYFTKKPVWMTGVILFVLVIIISFLGYVLPWGQMSFWAATVIVSLTTTLPEGEEIKFWILGGFSVDNATLKRFFLFHFLFPIILLFIIILHLGILHKLSSNNQLLIVDKDYTDNVHFFPYFWTKDFLGIILFLISFFNEHILNKPEQLMHPDNNIPANPMQTPEHIVPEWYFLLFYGILRSVPSKGFGVFLLSGAILILIIFPIICKIILVISKNFSIDFKLITNTFFIICLELFSIGGRPIEEPFYTLGQFYTICYFFYFFQLLWIEIKGFNLIK